MKSFPLFDDCFEPSFPTPPTLTTTPTEKPSDGNHWIIVLVITLVIVLVIIVICGLICFYKKRKAGIVQVPNTSTASTSDVTPQSTGLQLIQLVVFFILILISVKTVNTSDVNETDKSIV